jgi:hypothetical protein
MSVTSNRFWAEVVPGCDTVCSGRVCPNSQRVVLSSELNSKAGKQAALLVDC